MRNGKACKLSLLYPSSCFQATSHTELLRHCEWAKRLRKWAVEAVPSCPSASHAKGHFLRLADCASWCSPGPQTWLGSLFSTSWKSQLIFLKQGSGSFGFAGPHHAHHTHVKQISNGGDKGIPSTYQIKSTLSFKVPDYEVDRWPFVEDGSGKLFMTVSSFSLHDTLTWVMFSLNMSGYYGNLS